MLLSINFALFSDLDSCPFQILAAPWNGRAKGFIVLALLQNNHFAY